MADLAEWLTLAWLLQAFGNAFLQKFNVAEMTSPILEEVTLIDTPGVSF